ncbi:MULTISPECIES: hypothetical protein [unclassified Streptosporangium]|uniref:hypothetical protein n=1 Tax=unclassified Streptosporangium TaxID=2632669 RepID=UPI002E2D346C|nr:MULTISPECIES: hypothetical protein [unclassified Streptosporangium]
MTSPRMTVVRVATLLAALAVPLLLPTAAHADSHYVCADGTRFQLSQMLGHHVLATGCTGSGEESPVTIVISSGYHAGEHFCEQLLAQGPTLVSGMRCT